MRRRVTGDWGVRFGRYVLLERIGAGGMAEVFRAVAHGAEGFQRTFVLKRIRSDRSESSSFVDMFVNEARLSALLDHENIVQTYDFGEVEGCYFLTMEYLRGRRPGHHPARAAGPQPRRSSRPPWPSSALQVARGLAYAHGLDLAHGRAAQHRPPRRHPLEHHAAALGRREAARLRHRQDQGRVQPGREHRDRRLQGQAPLSVARAGGGAHPRSPLRSLHPGRRHVGGAHRQAAVPGAHRLRDHAERARARGARALEPAPRHPGGPRRDRAGARSRAAPTTGSPTPARWATRSRPWCRTWATAARPSPACSTICSGGRTTASR